MTHLPHEAELVGSRSRRPLLGIVGVTFAVVGVLLLAACGSSDSDGADTTTAPSVSVSSPGTDSLADTSWVLEPSSLGVAIPDGVEVTIAFSGDQVSGNSGCNRYSGTYETVGEDGLKLGPLMSTKMACEPAQASVEGAYLPKLDQVARYSVAGDRLTLGSAEGATPLTYTKQADTSGD